ADGGGQQHRGIAQVQRRARDRMEQQAGKQNEIDQLFRAREEGTVEVQVVQHGPAQGDQQEVGQDEGDDGHGGWPGWAALIVRAWGSGRPVRTGLEGPVVALRTRLSWELPLNNVNYYVFVSDNTSHSWVGFVQCIHVLNRKR